MADGHGMPLGEMAHTQDSGSVTRHRGCDRHTIMWLRFTRRIEGRVSQCGILDLEPDYLIQAGATADLGFLPGAISCYKCYGFGDSVGQLAISRGCRHSPTAASDMQSRYQAPGVRLSDCDSFSTTRGLQHMGRQRMFDSARKLLVLPILLFSRRWFLSYVYQFRLDP